MTTIIKLAILILGSLNLLCAQTILQKLESDLERVHQQSEIPGFALALVHKNEVVYQKGFGFADVEQSVPYTEKTIQQIASVSKTLIGLSLSKLVEEGKLTWDTPINDLLTFKVQNPSFPNLAITIRHLANHSSGILDDEGFLIQDYILEEKPPLALAAYPEPYDQLLAQAKTHKRRNLNEALTSYFADANWSGEAPGKQFNYSNIASALAAHIVESISGDSFAHYSKHLILEPLEMRASIWSSESLEANEIARNYLLPNIPLPRYSNNLYPITGLYSSVDDLSKFLIELIRGYSGTGTLLQKTSYQKLMTGQVEIGDQQSAPFFFIDEKGNIGHNGSDVGLASKLYFNPRTETGIVLLCNIGVDNDEALKRDFINIWKRMEKASFELVFGNQAEQGKFYEKYKPELLKKDLAILKHNLEVMHPGLYRYTSKEELDAQFEKIKAQLNYPMTELELYRLIGPLVTSIGNQHTEIEITEETYAPVEESMGLLPFGVKWLNDKLYIIKNLSSVDDISEGTEIISINGRSASSIFKQLRQYWSRDGYNLSSPNVQLSNAFMDYYALILGSQNQFDLELLNRQGQKLILNLPALTWTEILRFYKKRYPKDYKLAFKGKYKPKPYLNLKIEDRYAYFKIGTFHPDKAADRGQHFNQFLKEAFVQINQSEVEHLILDLRYNRGGSDVAVGELFSYLSEKAFRAYHPLSTISAQIPNHEYYQGDVAELEQWAKENLEKRGSDYLLPDQVASEEILPRMPTFKGQLYVLTNERTYSAAGDFTGLVKQHKKAIFIGEEPGGNPCENTAGNTLTLVLPNSKINVHIPTVLFRLQVDFENTGHGIIPDHRIIPSIEQWLEDEDVVLDFTKQLIKENMTKKSSQ